MKKIFIDMDMTLNKFWISFLERYNMEFGTSYSINKEFLTVYDFGDLLKLDKKTNHRIGDIFKREDFFLDIPPLEDIYENVKKLYNTFDVYIATTPFSASKKCYSEKVSWVEQYLPFFDPGKIIFIADKSLLDGDLLIDDKPSALETFNGLTATIDYPYNRSFCVHVREDNWNDLTYKIFRMLA